MLKILYRKDLEFTGLCQMLILVKQSQYTLLSIWPWEYVQHVSIFEGKRVAELQGKRLVNTVNAFIDFEVCVREWERERLTAFSPHTRLERSPNIKPITFTWLSGWQQLSKIHANPPLPLFSLSFFYVFSWKIVILSSLKCWPRVAFNRLNFRWKS